MVDEVDQTSDRIEFDNAVAIRNITSEAEKFKAGSPGDCDLCGETFSRVVLTEKNEQDVFACGRCRDKHGLK